MRHATRTRNLSRPTEQRKALLNGLIKLLVKHGHITTTVARAKEAQKMADRLVTFGKEGSIHARREAFRVLQDRTLVKQLFAEIAPRFTEIKGGYTRVVRSRVRPGDGAQLAVLAFTKLPVNEGVASVASAATAESTEPKEQQPESAESGKSGLFEGLRKKLSRKKGSTGA